MTVINGVNYALPSRLIPQDGLLVSMAEHFDQFIIDHQMKHPSVWRDRIPKGTMPLFNGYSQKSYIFRGTLGPQAGLNDWDQIEPSRKPAGTDLGNDRCTYTPQTYTWAFDAVDFSGFQTSWRSPVFCVNDLKFQDYAKEQLAYIIKAGAQITDQIKETFNREIYVKLAADAKKFTVLADGASLDYLTVGDTAHQVTYDPFTVDSNSSTYLTIPYDIFTDISTLNWNQLDLIRQYMADQCPDAAMGSDSGMPIFGLMIDLMDFERFILSDAKIREDFRQAIPQRLIDGFNMGFKVYRGFSLIHDPRQMRFSFESFTESTNTAKLIRVLPRKATRDGIIGHIPESNPDYVTAEYGTAIVFLDQTLQILVPPTVTNMGQGMTFSPQPGFNGEWTWLNIQDADDNPLMENGYFFSRYEYFPKPQQYAQEVTVLLYRRCTQSVKTVCAVEDEVSAEDSQFLGAVPAAGDFSATNRTVVLTLAGKLTAGVGAHVTVTNDASATFAAVIVSDSDAPTYTLAWISGGSNVPTAVTEINDPTITKVTVD